MKRTDARMAGGGFAAVCVAAAVLGLTACTGSLFQTKAKPPTVYLLSAGSVGLAVPASGDTPIKVAAGLAVDLAILKPRVRAGLESDRIAALYPDRRLDYFADASWSGPLDEVVQDLAVQVFHSHGTLHDVSGDASAFSSTHWLEITVLDFQAEYANSVTAPIIHVHLIGRAGSSTDRRVLARFEADAKVAATENRMGPIVDAYERAADQALTEIAAAAVAEYRAALP